MPRTVPSNSQNVKIVAETRFLLGWDRCYHTSSRVQFGTALVLRTSGRANNINCNCSFPMLIPTAVRLQARVRATIGTALDYLNSTRSAELL